MTGTTRRRRHSPAVYRRRRLVLLVAVLLIAGGIAWLLIAQPWRGLAAEPAAHPSPSASRSASADPTPSDSPTPSATPTSTPTSTPTATDGPDSLGTAKPCIARAIVVEPVTDADSYGSGKNPQLSITLTNNGEVDCTLNVGTSTQAFTITSGSDVWWRSTDCQTEPSDMIVTLSAGQTVTSATPLVWDRTRSSVSTCGDANRPVAPGGGASYHVSVEIGGIGSVQAKQILLY